MKKFLMTVVSFFYVISGYCQSKSLYLKSKDNLSFQTWDTIYAVKQKGGSIILRDKTGKEYKCTLDKHGSEFGSQIEIFQYRKSYPWYYRSEVGGHGGLIIMDNPMKLFFEKKSKPRSKSLDHSSHYSHNSHNSHISHYSSSF